MSIGHGASPSRPVTAVPRGRFFVSSNTARTSDVHLSAEIWITTADGELAVFEQVDVVVPEIVRSHAIETLPGVLAKRLGYSPISESSTFSEPAIVAVFDVRQQLRPVRDTASGQGMPLAIQNVA